MSQDDFYRKFIPETIKSYLSQDEPDEDTIPVYSPYLQGSRYSLENLTAGFSNLTLETDRQKMLLGLLRGNLQYLGGHLKEVSKLIRLENEIITTGGGAKLQGMNSLKKRWMGNFDYKYQDQSSLLGAAMLGQMYLKNL
jgi:sugar (pentulose or hexulose) kinase